MQFETRARLATNPPAGGAGANERSNKEMRQLCKAYLNRNYFQAEVNTFYPCSRGPEIIHRSPLFVNSLWTGLWTVLTLQKNYLDYRLCRVRTRLSILSNL